MLFRLNGRKALAFAAVPIFAAPNICDVESRMSGITAIEPPLVKKSDKPVRHRPSWIWNLVGLGGVRGNCPSWLRAGDVAAPMKVRRYEEISLCFKGFKSSDAPRLQVFGPDGERSQSPTKATTAVDGGLQWFWRSEDAGAIFKRPGVYRFTVTAAHTVGTSGSIVVKPAKEIGVYFSYDFKIRPGQAVTGMAVGRTPGSLVLASLYGEERGGKLRLRRDLEPVTADSNGEGIIRWVATKELRSGTYVLLVEPIASGMHECDLQCAVFQVKS